MRKLATIRRISELLPIEGADLVQLAKIDGWQCVVKKSEFVVGDLCVYFEIDSHLPVRPEFEILRRNSFKRMGEREGFRIKTIKLRGQLSQGLALPLDILGQPHEIFTIGEGCIGADVSDDLDVQKYEAAIPTELAGQVKGNFPGFIKKTDQERCQNMYRDIFVDNADARYEITMKLDGTSLTAYYNAGVEGVCGRNWDLKLDDPMNEHNSLIRMYVDSGLGAALRLFGKNYAVQGELMGAGIQKNREGLLVHKLFVFDIYDIDNSRYMSPADRHQIMEELWLKGVNRDMVRHVPLQNMSVTLSEIGITDITGLLAMAEGPSITHAIREGLVFKRMDGGFSFKAISNKFLLKEED
jgi:RNA ligase (TIGR02306 family)